MSVSLKCCRMMWHTQDSVIVINSIRGDFAGGKEGAAGAFYRVATDGTVTKMGHKTTSFPLKKGDVIRVTTPGAGGYGDPMKRDPEKVLEDVKEKKYLQRQQRRNTVWLLYPMELITM